MKKFIILCVVFIALFILLIVMYVTKPSLSASSRGGSSSGVSRDNSKSSITNYEDCLKAGNPVLKTNPPKCKTSDGRVFEK